MITSVVGLQFGDEGKGKVVDFLAGRHDVVVKYNGGRNAGHTVVTKAGTFKFHLIPSGSLRAKEIILANGMTIDPMFLVEEIENAKKANPHIRIFVSKLAHVVTEIHTYLDTAEEAARGKMKIGTTAKGIGPAYEDKYGRTGVRMEDLLSPELLKEKLSLIVKMKDSLLRESKYGVPAEIDRIVLELSATGKKVAEFLCDTEQLLNDRYRSGDSILFEGSHGAMLDVDFGMYPYVTSSNTISGAISASTGFPARKLQKIVGVVKSYTSRVGDGPFPTEIHGDMASTLRDLGREYGTTTGRPRRVGWLDLQLVKYAVMINDVDTIALTSVDTLGKLDTVRVATGYYRNGKEVAGIVRHLGDLDGIEVRYREFKPWGALEDSQISDIVENGQDSMPVSMREFIDFVQERCGRPVEFVSLGNLREKTLILGSLAKIGA